MFSRPGSTRDSACDVYSYDAVPDAEAQIDGLPVAALPAFAELMVFLELTPWAGTPYRADKPDGNMRSMPFGKRAEGMAVYVILEEQRRVVVVSVTWLELSGSVDRHHSRAAGVGPRVVHLPLPLTPTRQRAAPHFSIFDGHRVLAGGPSRGSHSRFSPPGDRFCYCCYGMVPPQRPDDREKTGKCGPGRLSAEVIG